MSDPRRPMRGLDDPVRPIAEAFPWIADWLREIEHDIAARNHHTARWKLGALLYRLEGKS
jgi:hypothetical protein